MAVMHIMAWVSCVWFILVSNERLISEGGWAGKWWGIFSLQNLLTALYVILVIDYIHKTFAVMYSIVNENMYRYSTIYVLLVPHGFMLLVPFRKGGVGSVLSVPHAVYLVFFISPVIIHTYLAGCPSYLQYLVLALSCNLFVLGWHTRAFTQVFAPLVVTLLIYIYIKWLYSMSG